MSDTPLLELLGRHWSLGSAVDVVAFDAAGETVAFALASGHVALAPVADADSAMRRYRIAGDNGRASIAPRRKPVAPLTQVAVGPGPLRLSPFGSGGFVVSAAAGDLTRLQPDGVQAALPPPGGRIHAMAAMHGGSVLVAADEALVLLRPDAEQGDRQTIKTRPGECAARGPLAVDDSGQWLAQGDGDALLLRRCEPGSAIEVRLDDLPTRSMAWSPDGNWLALALATEEIVVLRVSAGQVSRTIRLPGYPAPVRSLSWDPASRLLATGGAFRIVVWPVGQFDGREGPPKSLPTGRAGLVAVEAVAVHPRRPFVAAGFENGMVVVAKIDGRDELVIRPPQPGAITALVWSPDGDHLAFGTQEGTAAVVTLPPQMFK